MPNRQLLVGLAVGVAAVPAVLLAPTTAADQAPSRDVAADANSRGAVVSADGRCVAFWSVATNLTPRHLRSRRRAYVRNVRAKQTVLVSRQSEADGGAPADGKADDVAISGDGRFVAFRSYADNLSGADRDETADVFLRDLKSERTTLVSRQSATEGGAAADTSSNTGSVSASGRYVAFWSWARNLSRADQDNSPDVFVRDLKTKRTLLVSRQSAADGGAGGAQASYSASISANGRYVTFFSNADNLSDADPNGRPDVFVRDLETKRTVLVSRRSGADGVVGNGSSYSGGISADGRFVAFTSFATNLDDAAAGGGEHVYLRDTQTNETILVSRQSAADGDAPGNGASNRPVVSADGRYVAFSSLADNLSGADDDRARDIFVRDLQGNETILVSRQGTADGGAGGDRDSNAPSISADGRYVTFWSYANNLSRADREPDKYGYAPADVFLRDLRNGTTTLVSRADATRRQRPTTCP